MTLIPWKNKQRGSDQPETSRMLSLRDEIDRLFDAFVREPFGAIDWPFSGFARWTPAIDIAEDDKEVTLRAELPGVEAGDLDVSISGNQLVLSGEKKETSQSETQDSYHSEARYGSFRRSITLPDGIDTENVDARCANGVLTLRLKKTAAAAPKRVEIKVKD